MNLLEIQKFAREMMDAYGLKEWRFELNGRLFRVLGRCKFRGKVIELSKTFAQQGTQEQILDTILHEIAHALVGVGHGHDWVWKAKAREIGANPSACKSVELLGKYNYQCPNCNKITGKARKTTRSFACGDCCKKYNYGRYSTKYVMVAI